MKTLIFILFTLFATASGEPTGSNTKSSKTMTVTGKATYYASKFHGRRTTSGEVFSNKKLTAAHLKLPFGTIVNVTNVDNGRTVEVRINDRGPHSKFYIIDLSQAAAKKIGMFGKGVANVEITYTLPGE
ncbi:septal ring lytic transglycosylase RlpA family protein [Daejeonella lutea]|uniref:Probable endolytic peptidoglycan transglycosylase RlpA n=1 Tax=Daejeonella lutea TaxID=572036 RepID=A0A1T5BZZ8_9SPHI|nr:septal ring lytic transglycosylase RlpA family protein [Daejeonella lutea]SKB52470.1 rare lipoprotein A [Daejeonella lutea]